MTIYQDYYGTLWELQEQPHHPEHMTFRDCETGLFVHYKPDSNFAKTLKYV
jgi:hypothetical protein